ncbi:hypothetical protein RIF29_03787 [Crotalaria pallida]|uniref:Uncharacterized protein n=1 Tax=Crotalaria pallida TaxID=3830 RepID=A0AAN9J0H1_CROPI
MTSQARSSSPKTKTPSNDDPLIESNDDMVDVAMKLMQPERGIDGEVVNPVQSEMKTNKNIEMVKCPKKLKKYRSLADIYKVGLVGKKSIHRPQGCEFNSNPSIDVRILLMNNM